MTCSLAADPSVIVVDRDNVEITTSCTVRVALAAVPDADDDGVIHITADDVRVEFEAGSILRGAPADDAPDTYHGVGIRVTGERVILIGARVSGYKAAIHATNADGLVVDGCDVSDNFRQRLRSTPRVEDPVDWLSPHDNDENEWLARYGAGIYVEDSNHVTVQNARARNVQNGIILDRVNDSMIRACDCSFLSGWGLALWRSCRNVIAGNAFDFCVRGYSHGVYNRGQDSAGILMFEQCEENVIARNSVTHGGDGLFAFAGREALGEKDPRDDGAWYVGRGNNRNLVVGNDLSYAAAHGLELTFSFDNQVRDNRFVDNAICGIWGGYSQRTLIGHNEFRENGALGYGLERGGVNIEHGVDNTIIDNEFMRNRCGVHLWWDEDEGILRTPWAAANHPARGAFANRVDSNAFEGDDLALHVRRAGGVTMFRANTFVDVAARLDADAESPVETSGPAPDAPALSVPVLPPDFEADGPVGRRPELRGRDKIIMTEWGPYDWKTPLLHLVERGSRTHAYELLGRDLALDDLDVRVEPALPFVRDGSRISVGPVRQGAVQPYVLTVSVGERTIAATGTIASLEWRVLVFPLTADPREDDANWEREAKERGVLARPVSELRLQYGMRGPRETLGLPDAPVGLGPDHFGTLASSVAWVPRGRWRIRTTSDDGIRVLVDDEPIIDDWTWHAPKEHVYEFEVDEQAGRTIRIRVEHFELDGYATLSLEIESVR